MIIGTAHKQRAHLMAREGHAARALALHYGPVRHDLTARVGVVLHQLADAQAAGEKPGPARLYQHGWPTLAAHITSSVNGYAAGALSITAAAQETAAHSGTADATELLHGALAPLRGYGIGVSFDRAPVEALGKIIGRAGDGKPLGKLFQGFGVEAAANVRRTLQTAIITGLGPLTVARQVAQDLDVPLWRARTIAANEMLGAYRDAASATYRANADVVDEWIWFAELGTACAACTAMHGSRHGLDEDLNSHVKCRCTQLPATKSYADILSAAGIDTSGLDLPDSGVGDIQSGADWLADQPAAVQRDVLGSNAAYQAYNNGDVELSDFVGHDHDPEWGDSIYAKSAKELGV